MKNFICLFGLLCSWVCVEAQLYDKNWIYGADIYDTSLFSGNGILRFETDSVVIRKEQFNLPISYTAIAVSSSNGDLLFYSNGMRIMDSTKTLALNGDSLNFGVVWEYLLPDLIQGYSGYSEPNNLLFLPIPSNDSIGFLFHVPGDYIGSDSGSHFCLTTIQLSPVIRIIEKNRILSYTESPASCNMSACKHGNGRDWWIIYQEANTNCYLKYLLTPDTLVRFERQCLGDTVYYTESIGARFSPDGTKYIAGAAFSGLNLFDFDRCSGQFSNHYHLPGTFVHDSINGFQSWVNSMIISPNNKFLYTVMTRFIFQYDLTSTNIVNSRDTITALQPYTDSLISFIGPYQYFSCTYGLDGKIYIGPTIVQRSFCVIGNPDSAGLACDFRLRALQLPTLIYFYHPYIPNYRLGRFSGSACDTLYSDLHPMYAQTPWLKVYPNPASDMVRFDYNWVEWELIADCELTIADLQGRVVLQHKVPKYSSRQDISIKNLAAGIYTANLRDNVVNPGGKIIASCKIVKD